MKGYITYCKLPILFHLGGIFEYVENNRKFQHIELTC